MSVGYSVPCFHVYNEGVKKFILLCIYVSFSLGTGCEMTFTELTSLRSGGGVQAASLI